jgi:hypothetical protein
MVQCNEQISDLSIHTTHNSERTCHLQDTQKTLQNTAKEPKFSRNNLNDTQMHSDNKKETTT